MGGNNKTTSSLVKQNMHLNVSSFPSLHKQLILEVAYLLKTKMSQQMGISESVLKEIHHNCVLSLFRIVRYLICLQIDDTRNLNSRKKY